MKIYRTFLLFFFLFTVSISVLSCKSETTDYTNLMLLAGVCSDPPAAPTSLQSSGSLGQIALTWVASIGPGVTGYNVYRSTDGTNFTKITSTPIAASPYDDAITPSGDGVIYYYRVTAVGSCESVYSNVTKNVHGT